jgi:flagellar basal body-associated protein FliL
MIKLIIVGVVGAMSAAAGASYALMSFGNGADAAAVEEPGSTIENISTELTAVPIVKEGKVAGYMVMKITSRVDKSKLKYVDTLLNPYLNDAVFRAAFDFASGGVTEVTSKHVQQLAESVAGIANARLGGAVVLDVHLEQFNIVSSDEIRSKLNRPK